MILLETTHTAVYIKITEITPRVSPTKNLTTTLRVGEPDIYRIVRQVPLPPPRSYNPFVFTFTSCYNKNNNITLRVTRDNI